MFTDLDDDGDGGHARLVWGGGSTPHDVDVTINLPDSMSALVGETGIRVNWAAMGSQPTAFAANYGALIQLASEVADDLANAMKFSKEVQPTDIDKHFEVIRNTSV